MGRIALIISFFGIGFLLLGVIANLLGIRINTTKSIPIGLYQLTKDVPLEKNAYVIFCPPVNKIFDEAMKRGYIKAGLCPGKYGYMMKKILAAKKDTVNVSDDGVRVNGLMLPLSKPLMADKANRPLPLYRAEVTLNESEFFLMSDVSGISFDGRYFGAINNSQIISVIRPIFTW